MGPIPVLLLLAAISGFAHSQDCPVLYRRYCKDHTGCKTVNSACNIRNSGLSEADKELILKAHNDYRSRVAMGRETTGPLPSASNMLQMVWNNELADVAQRHANQCDFEHEPNECREVQDFSVGQNLYEFATSGTDDLTPDWNAAVAEWNKEINNFEPANVDSISSVPDRGVTGHLTQVIWAKSWQVGCGYVQYDAGGKRRELYTCNYGTAGNVQTAAVYESGESCSNCPENTCCGSKCNIAPNYDGLCQVLPHKIPVYPPPKKDYIYYCDFQDLSKCPTSTDEAEKSWTVHNTLSGSYIGIVLNGGESSTLKFLTELKKKVLYIPRSNSKAEAEMCISVFYRKGPNVDGQTSGTSVAKELFQVLPDGYKFDIDLKKDSKRFLKYKLYLPHSEDLSFAIQFSVDDGSPAQYFEVDEIVALTGDC